MFRIRRRAAHYAQKTVATSAPEFLNHEQDVIRQSFSSGNHTWMKEALPVELAPDTINQLRRQRMERNRLAEPLPQTWSKMTQLWGGGCYKEFEYIPDEYSRKDDLAKKMRADSVKDREHISNHDWRYASQEKRLKFETIINDPRNKETYPYLGGDKDMELQAGKHFLRGASQIGSRDAAGQAQTQSVPSESSFLAGRGSGLDDNSRGSRMTLSTVVQRLQSRLDQDWEDTTVVVSVTDQDLVQIAFHMGTVDSERGVAAYMNVLSKDPELLGQLGLRKVSQLWGMKRDFSSEMSLGDIDDVPEIPDVLANTWIFYLLTPKWVRMRPTDAYYTTHPRSQGSAFRMSTAGSSVLLSLGSSVLDPTEVSRMSKRGDSRSDEGGYRSARVRGASSQGEGEERRVDVNTIERALGGLPSIREANRGGGGRPPPLSAR